MFFEFLRVLLHQIFHFEDFLCIEELVIDVLPVHPDHIKSECGAVLLLVEEGNIMVGDCALQFQLLIFRLFDLVHESLFIL